MSEFIQVESLARAWILVQADDAVAVAEQLYGLNEKLEWPHSRVVRAAVVEGNFGVNVVAPAWAPDESGLQKLQEMIRGLKGVEEVGMLVVQRGERGLLEFPFPPHKAHGYVPVEESNPGAVPLGFNGWG